MATLTITDFDSATFARLESLARRNGTSAGEEAARLLILAVSSDQPEPSAQQSLDRAEALAAAEALRQLVMGANSGRMPDDSVDQFIAEKRAEVAAEEAAFAASLATRARPFKP
jgi:acyl transferase domain-containing protein